MVAAGAAFFSLHFTFTAIPAAERRLTFFLATERGQVAAAAAVAVRGSLAQSIVAVYCFYVAPASRMPCRRSLGCRNDDRSFAGTSTCQTKCTVRLKRPKGWSSILDSNHQSDWAGCGSFPFSSRFSVCSWPPVPTTAIHLRELRGPFLVVIPSFLMLYAR